MREPLFAQRCERQLFNVRVSVSSPKGNLSSFQKMAIEPESKVGCSPTTENPIEFGARVMLLITEFGVENA